MLSEGLPQLVFYRRDAVPSISVQRDPRSSSRSGELLSCLQCVMYVCVCKDRRPYLTRANNHRTRAEVALSSLLEFRLIPTTNQHQVISSSCHHHHHHHQQHFAGEPCSKSQQSSPQSTSSSVLPVSTTADLSRLMMTKEVDMSSKSNLTSGRRRSCILILTWNARNMAIMFTFTR